MSRTRLDEIVEEEWGTAIVKEHPAWRIAERAFRHGVEQCEAQLLTATGTKWSVRVQPAPVEENPRIDFTPCPSWCDRPNNHFDFPCKDRRKGERRKGQKQGECCLFHHFLGECGRRSGKERRK